MKRFRKVLLSILLAVMILPAISAAAAGAQVSNISVTAHPGNDRYSILSFDFTASGEEYSVFLTGIRATADPSLWAPELAQKIADSAAGNGKLRIVDRKTGKANEYPVTSFGLMDAEKQNLTVKPDWKTYEAPGFPSDSLLCWAAAASNALEISGWGRAVTGLNPGKVDFQNEDDLFDYFAKNFTDEGHMASHGYQWFLNGSNLYQVLDEETKEPLFGVHHWVGVQLTQKGSGGLAKEYSASSVTRWTDYGICAQGAGHLVTQEGLNQGADDLEKGWGVALGLEFIGTAAGHDLTLVGTVRAKNGDVVNVILADSDNDAAEYDYDDKAAASAAGSRRDRVNSFEMYPVKLFTIDEDYQGMTVTGHWMYPDDPAGIADIMSIKPFRETLPKETEGTVDVYASPDLVPIKISVGDGERQIKTAINENVPIYAEIGNHSFVRVTGDPSAVMTLRYTVRRNGAVYDILTKDVTLDGSWLLPNGHNDDGSEVGYVFTETGIYEIGVEVLNVRDSKGNIREAYTLNNRLDNYARVTVLTSLPPLYPPTGDGTPLLLLIALLVFSVTGILAVYVDISRF